MQVKKEVLDLLKDKSLMQETDWYPRLVDDTLVDIANNKLNNYSDIIRMSTSDRNKAKSTINVLTSLYYKLDEVSQRLYSVMFSELRDISVESRRSLIHIVSKIFDENFIMVFEKLYPVQDNTEQDTEEAEYLLIYQTLLAELLEFPTEHGKETLRPSGVINIIVHGELYSLYKSSKLQQEPSSLLITHYLKHLDLVNSQLKEDPIDYLTTLVKVSKMM